MKSNVKVSEAGEVKQWAILVARFVQREAPCIEPVPRYSGQLFVDVFQH